MDSNEIEGEIARISRRLEALDSERAELRASLAKLEAKLKAVDSAAIPSSASDAPVTNTSSSVEKVALFRSLFAGRADVFPIRWENRKTGRSGYSPACANEWVPGVCGKPKIRCGSCSNQKFIPLSDHVIVRHLRGGEWGREFVAGIYPMLKDETCRFLAADFDKEAWADDAQALLETCRARGIAAALERSRSGNGGHVWIFFDDPVSGTRLRIRIT